MKKSRRLLYGWPGLALFSSLFALWALKPLIKRPWSLLPVIPDSTLNTFIITRGIQNILYRPCSLFDARTFYPFEGSMAFSEHLYGLSPLGIPLYLVNNSPVLIHNFLLFLTFPAAAVAGYLLIKKFTLNRLAPWVGGFLFAFSPLRMDEIGRIQLVTGYWLPIGLLGAFLALTKQRLKYHAIWGAALVMQAASCWYLFFYLSIALTIVFLFAAAQGKLKGHWKPFLLVSLCSLFIIFITSLPYLINTQRYKGYHRLLSHCKLGSADVSSYLNLQQGHPLSSPLSHFNLAIRSFVHTHFSNVPRAAVKPSNLFPGFLPVIGGLLSLFLSLPAKSRILRRWSLVFLIVFAVLSLGPELHFFGKNTEIPLPYLLLFKYVPGFGSMRTPYRMAIGAALAWICLSSLAIDRLWDKIKMQKPLIKITFLAGMMIFAILDVQYYSFPTKALPTYRNIPKVYRWLEKLEADVVALELPFKSALPPQNKQENPANRDNRIMRLYPVAVEYQYYSLFHKKRLVNGHSGYDPKAHLKIADALKDFPSEKKASAALRETGADILIIHKNMLPEDKIEAIESWGRGEEGWLRIADFGHDSVYVPRGGIDRRMPGK